MATDWHIGEKHRQLPQNSDNVDVFEDRLIQSGMGKQKKQTKNEGNWFVRALPHLALFTSTVAYMLIGAALFRSIDPQIGGMPYHSAVVFAFGLMTTIGWGDAAPSTQWSRIFLIVFTALGVPLCFAALANAGRLLTEFYTVDWLYFTAIVRGKKSFSAAKVSNQISVRFCLNLIIVHFFIGLLLFNGVIQDMGTVEGVYFTSVTIETIGIGDFRPEPSSGVEAVILILYFSFGIIVVSALFLNLSYYIQVMIYIHFAEFVHNCHGRLEDWSEKRRKSADSESRFGMDP